MATLVLGTVGTLLGGPVGGAIGALAGRQIDTAIGGSASREGPRLTELAISSSSYGQPIPRHFGVVRAPGVIVWATDLVESKETSGGGKGKPKTTSYSYSISLAVALSSTPIQGVGRIWADGNLLRGAAGDLKTAGQLRIYTGEGNQLPDPLIQSAEAVDVPAMRGCAYVVFEDLSLADFGNRVPALSFEIFESNAGNLDLAEIAAPASSISSSLEGVSGFSDNGGPLISTLRTIDEVSPIACTLDAGRLSLTFRAGPGAMLGTLPEPLADSGDTAGGKGNGASIRRGTLASNSIGGLRYYDRDRDYQIGVQRSSRGHAESRDRILEFPATTSATDALILSISLSKRNQWRSERVLLRIADLDSELMAGRHVSIPGMPGAWRIASWEWTDRGIELELERSAPFGDLVAAADAGDHAPPEDLLAQATRIWAIELPPIDVASAQAPSHFAALTGAQGWSGATLYKEVGGGLIALDQSTRQAATIGHLVTDLAPSNATHLERNASIEIDLVGHGGEFLSSSIGAIANGSNRLYLAGEIIQFILAKKVGNTRWKLSGLLRGRGGTEHLANETRSAGATAILVDSALVRLDAGEGTWLAAIGLGDSEPALAAIERTGISTAPLSPVHAVVDISTNGDWLISWERRARGAWKWLDQVDSPLVEEKESYVVGIGPVEDPVAIWTTSEPELQLSQSEVAAFAIESGPSPIWVRQVGTYGQSPATFIANIH